MAESVNYVARTASAKMRKIQVKFKNGKLLSADTSLEPNENTDTSDSRSGPLDREKIAEGLYVSSRAYKIDDKTMEVRIKFEYELESGKVTQYMRGVYKQETIK